MTVESVREILLQHWLTTETDIRSPYGLYGYPPM